MPDPCFSGISRGSLCLTASILFGQTGFIITLSGIGMIHSPCQSLTIVPRHPFRGAGGQFLSMTLQYSATRESSNLCELSRRRNRVEAVDGLSGVK
jgi:hypothetical protein